MGQTAGFAAGLSFSDSLLDLNHQIADPLHPKLRTANTFNDREFLTIITAYLLHPALLTIEGKMIAMEGHNGDQERPAKVIDCTARNNPRARIKSWRRIFFLFTGILDSVGFESQSAGISKEMLLFEIIAFN